jgi:mono/diheme cytochrome c family protein
MIKVNKAAVLILSILVLGVLAFQSLGQGTPQDPKPANNNAAPAPQETPRAQPTPPSAEELAKLKWELPPDAAKTKNPVASSAESIAKGKELFETPRKGCVFCHGETGAGNEANLARLRRKPADLTNKERMTKMTDGEVFWKVTLGIPFIMPGREKVMTEEERWHVVNYVRTLAADKKE